MNPFAEYDEAYLVEQTEQGNKSAIDELYCRYVDVIYRYTYARIGNSTVAEELASRIFSKAFESLSNYQPDGKPFLTWLYPIAHARTSDHWQLQKRHTTLNSALR